MGILNVSNLLSEEDIFFSFMSGWSMTISQSQIKDKTENLKSLFATEKEPKTATTLAI